MKNQTTPAHPKGGQPAAPPKYYLVFCLRRKDQTLSTFSLWGADTDKLSVAVLQKEYLADWKAGKFTLEVNLVGVNVPANEIV